MPASTLLRRQIERTLERRFPAALSPVSRVVETAPTGIGEVDDLLEGGLAVGAITEFVGTECSGRTSLALGFLARLTGEDRLCAWIDTDDRLDPESAAATGVALRRLLWVRCRSAAAMANRTPWPRLEQAIRATDLLLQAGGFAAIVLDLAGTAAEHSRRIPLATWFRFRQAAARTRCSLVVLGQAACAQSSAAVVLECVQLRPHTEGETILGGFTFMVARSLQRHGPAVCISSGMEEPGPLTMDDSPGCGGWSGKPPASVRPETCAWYAEQSL